MRRKSSITFVTEFEGAESYRFFFGVGSDFEYELELLPTVDGSGGATGRFEHGGDCRVACAPGRRSLGGWCSVPRAPGQRLLLPLRGVEGTRRMRENVRDAEVCVALVGDILRATEEQSFE